MDRVKVFDKDLRGLLAFLLWRNRVARDKEKREDQEGYDASFYFDTAGGMVIAFEAIQFDRVEARQT